LLTHCVLLLFVLSMQTAEEELTRMYSSAHAVVARAVAAAEARAAAAEATASGMVQAARGAHEGLRAALQVGLNSVLLHVYCWQTEPSWHCNGQQVQQGVRMKA
jgi:hypothetical protein